MSHIRLEEKAHLRQVHIMQERGLCRGALGSGVGGGWVGCWQGGWEEMDGYR